MSLVLQGIEKSYPEFKMKLSFTVEKGRILTLLGPSGCGKTTTLHLIAGFITPDRGDISINGKNVGNLPPHLRQVGVVFQDYALFPNMNVFSNIAFGLRMHRWGKREIKHRVRELLQLIHLQGYEERIVTQLSGGEQQRIALARALAPHPQLLLLDEPLSALDAKLRKDLRGEIKRIQRELNITTVYVTHDQVEALSISDKIVVMKDGQIEQTGSPWDIYNRPETGFVASFMGMTNRIDARVVSSDVRYTELDTPEGIFRALFPHILTKDSHVALLFRPEKCRLHPSHPASEKSDLYGGEIVLNTLTGTVQALEYLGESTVIEIRTHRGTYTARFSEQVPAGEAITMKSSSGIMHTGNDLADGPRAGSGYAGADSTEHPVAGPVQSGTNTTDKPSKMHVPFKTGDRVIISVSPENCWILTDLTGRHNLPGAPQY